jgi:hypothetical protein
MSNILDLHISRGGGVIAGPQGLGILIGDDPSKCPCGWIFVDVNSPPPNTQAVLESLRNARKEWPEKVTISKSGEMKSESV